MNPVAVAVVVAVVVVVAIAAVVIKKRRGRAQPIDRKSLNERGNSHDRAGKGPERAPV